MEQSNGDIYDSVTTLSDVLVANPVYMSTISYDEETKNAVTDVVDRLRYMAVKSPNPETSGFLFRLAEELVNEYKP